MPNFKSLEVANMWNIRRRLEIDIKTYENIIRIDDITYTKTDKYDYINHTQLMIVIFYFEPQTGLSCVFAVE